jgi:hypothetical protein
VHRNSPVLQPVFIAGPLPVDYIDEGVYAKRQDLQVNLISYSILDGAGRSLGEGGATVGATGW